VAVGRINGVVALTWFSHKKKKVWAFRQDKKKCGRINEVTVRQGFTVLLIIRSYKSGLITQTDSPLGGSG